MRSDLNALRRRHPSIYSTRHSTGSW